MIDEKTVGQLMAALSRMETELTNLRGTVGTLQNVVATQTGQITALNTTNQHLATEVMQLRAIVSRLACVEDPEHDTNPECLQSVRPKLRSISDDEPDSVVTRQMDLRASKSGIEVKGPSIMVVALGLVFAAGLAAWVWAKHLLLGG